MVFASPYQVYLPVINESLLAKIKRLINSFMLIGTLAEALQKRADIGPNEIETQFTVRRPRRPTATTYHIPGRRPSAKLIISMLVQPDRLDRNLGHGTKEEPTPPGYTEEHNHLSFCRSIDFEYSRFRREL